MNQIWLLILISLALGSLNAWYLRTRGYRQFSYWFLSCIAVFGLLVTILKLIG